MKVAIPYWLDKPHVMYHLGGGCRYPESYACARTIAWFLFGDPHRTDMW